jgi:hypothetical protein
MSAIPTVPVRIKPEAAERIAELGLQAEVDQALQRVQQVVPQLGHIDVEPREPYDTAMEPGVIISVWCRLPYQEARDIEWSLYDWRGDTFPRPVIERLSFMVFRGGNDAGEKVSGSGPGVVGAVSRAAP